MQMPRRNASFDNLPPPRPHCRTGEINSPTDSGHTEIFGTYLVVVGDKEQEQGHGAQN